MVVDVNVSSTDKAVATVPKDMNHSSISSSIRCIFHQSCASMRDGGEMGATRVASE